MPQARPAPRGTTRGRWWARRLAGVLLDLAVATLVVAAAAATAHLSLPPDGTGSYTGKFSGLQRLIDITMWAAAAGLVAHLVNVTVAPRLLGATLGHRATGIVYRPAPAWVHLGRAAINVVTAAVTVAALWAAGAATLVTFSHLTGIDGLPGWLQLPAMTAAVTTLAAVPLVVVSRPGHDGRTPAEVATRLQLAVSPAYSVTVPPGRG